MCSPSSQRATHDSAGAYSVDTWRWLRSLVLICCGTLAHAWLGSPSPQGHEFAWAASARGAALPGSQGGSNSQVPVLQAGFAEVEITPDVGEDRAVWLAGYLPGRRAESIHDPLFARCVVLSDGLRKIALVSVDLIGLQYPLICDIREQLDDFHHVTIGSTHNHQGPDVIGIWGRSFFSSGRDEAYITTLREKLVQVVASAEKSMVACQVQFGVSQDETLLDDTRRPIAKDGILRALRFVTAEGKASGLVVQWNCHPETLGAKNKQLTADFPAATVAALKARYECPVVYFSGSLGGLMAPPADRIRDAQGQVLREGDFRYCEAYGQAVAQLAERALNQSEPIQLTPFRASAARIAIPVSNPWYRAARATQVVKREGRVWTGDFRVVGEKVNLFNALKQTAVETEVSLLQLGQLDLVCIPGEIYPELIYGTFQEPVAAGADFPDAPLEPTLISMVRDAKRWMLLGLANDEIGYIIPRRQWDRVAPFCYDQQESQYGEINSCGAWVAPIIMEALSERFQALRQPSQPAAEATESNSAKCP